MDAKAFDRFRQCIEREFDHIYIVVAFNALSDHDHVHIVVKAETEKQLNEHIRKIKGFSSHDYQRSQNWDKGQHVWAQKFNRQLIEGETALRD